MSFDSEAQQLKTWLWKFQDMRFTSVLWACQNCDVHQFHSTATFRSSDFLQGALAHFVADLDADVPDLWGVPEEGIFKEGRGGTPPMEHKK